MRISLSVRVALLASCAICFSTGAMAQDILLDPVVLAKSKRGVQTNTATSETVVTEEEVEDRQAGTIAELVDTVPGVTLVNGSSPQGSGINIRGFGANGTYGSDQKVLIQVDGANVGSEELYRIGTQLYTDPSLYKEVTVVRGVAGTFEYGSGAIGGLVRLETKDASDFTGGEPGFKLRQTLQFGSNGGQFASSSILAWQPTEDLELLGNYTYRSQEAQKDGNSDNVSDDGYELPSWAVKARYRFGQDRAHALTLSMAETTSQETDVPYNSFASATDNFGNVDRGVFSETRTLRYTYDAPGNDWLNLTVEHSRAEQQIDSSYVAGSSVYETNPYVWPSLQPLVNADHRYVTTKTTAKNQSIFTTGALSHDLRYGYEHIQKDRLDASSAPGGKDLRDAFFVVDDIQWGGLTLTPAVRYEKQAISSDYGDYANEALMGGLSARYAFDNGMSVFGSAAYSENLPILDDLSNADYMERSEKAHTFELGAAFERTSLFSGGDSAALKLTHYRTEVWDVTSYSGVTNIALQGYELEGSYSTESGFYTDVNSTWSFGRDTTNGENNDWQYTPANSLSVAFGKRWGQEFDLSWEVVANAEREYNDVTTEQTVVHNLRGTYRPQNGALEGFEVRVGLENAADLDYTPYLATRAASGRNLKLTLTKTF